MTRDKVNFIKLVHTSFIKKVVEPMKEEKFMRTILAGLLFLLFFIAYSMFQKEQEEEGGILVKDWEREAIVLEGNGYLSESGAELLF